MTRVDVLTPIHFDDEHRLQTSEVGNVWTDWNLPAESNAHLTTTNLSPERLLCIRRLITKLSGSVL
ncbi:MAG TPA: hypothetical protein VK629_15960 [Steroidobacteraceae bacterium]|nr:hypothetical protein [Steroidobacteraceae bacterium]